MRYVREGLLVVGVTTLLVVLTIWEERSAPPQVPLLLIGSSLCVSLPLLLRRVLPLTSAVLSAVVGLGGLGFLPAWPGMLVTMGAFCAAVYHRERGPGLVLAACGCWVLVSAVIAGSPVQVFTVTDLVVMGVAPVATGYALRLHRERAEQTLRVQRAEADRVLAEERAQLARDVHDSVGHHLTAIRMQATAVRRVLGGAPPVADRALGTIAELSSSALDEVRGLLSALRDGPVGVVGLGELEQLVERLSGPGRRITVTRTGVAVAVPPAVDHTAYRVVQEALTNVVRHSTAGVVDVRVHRGRGRLVVTVVDDGVGQVGGLRQEGQGIRGMRERVRLVGGTLVVGPGESGWSVRAELPTGGGVGAGTRGG
ncbi:sensor histidine kinase [Saccharothrix sp. NRRL B-16348]|uniref:sensor histidine kinase n=1 Tax=Saccharothrix sp. NRRL B-16348 TaxID=1415542 RepID=UPI0006AF1ECA|nr:histidine kinase [Saccharothrix sp. NRRL B-16348]